MITLAFLVMKPFISALLASVFLAYMFHPIYRWVKEKIKSENAAAIIISVIIIVLLLAPLFFVLNTLTKEAYVSYLTSKQKLLTMGDFFNNCPDENPLCGFISYIGDFLDEPKVKYHLQNTLERVTSYIIDTASDLVFSIPRFVLNFFVMIFSLFYLFKDGPGVISDLKRILPLRDVYKRHLFDKFGKVTFAIVYGYMVIALLQGFLGGLGFFIFGVSSPIIWGIVMAFAALIPFVGTGIVWLPAALFKLFSGISAGNPSEIWGGILFILYGLILISSIDNVIRPKIISNRAKVHPVLILVGVLGGLALIGPIGAVAGPLILALFITFVRAYEQERYPKKSK